MNLKSWKEMSRLFVIELALSAIFSICVKLGFFV